MAPQVTDHTHEWSAWQRVIIALDRYGHPLPAGTPVPARNRHAIAGWTRRCACGTSETTR